MAHRGLVQQAFSRREMVQWETNVIAPVVSEHLDRIEGQGHAELVKDLTFLFPVFVIAAMLGLPKEDLEDFHRWSVEMICFPFDPAMGMAGSAKLADYFMPLVAKRRRDPQHDVISTLATAQLDGQSLSDEEIVSFLRFLLEAGAETTYRSSSNLFYGLLSNPEVLDAVRKDRTLLPQAIEEALRWEPPLTGIFRGAAIDTELAGVEVPKGAFIALNIGAANRDETRLGDDPTSFDIYRTPIPHVAFGYRAPHLPRDAPRPNRDDGGGQRGARSVAQRAPRSRRRRHPHLGQHVPRPANVADRLRLRTALTWHGTTSSSAAEAGAKASSWRRGPTQRRPGRERKLFGASRICSAEGGTLTIYLYENLNMVPGQNGEYIKAFAERYLPLYEEYDTGNLLFSGMFMPDIMNSTQPRIVILWTIPSWESWANRNFSPMRSRRCGRTPSSTTPRSPGGPDGPTRSSDALPFSPAPPVWPDSACPARWCSTTSTR